MTDAIETTVTGEATAPRTIGMTKTVTATETETVVTMTVSDVAAMTTRATTTTASESVNATGPGKLRSTTEGDYNEWLGA
jgi:hypothetical protein